MCKCGNVQVCRIQWRVSIPGRTADTGTRRWCSLICTFAHLHISWESRPDFIHKMKLAMKELAEARMWLRILAAGRYFDASHLAPLVDESLQLSRIMGKGVSTARRRLREEGEALE